MPPLFVVDGLEIAIRRDQEWRTVVRGASLSVERGETLALVGESASGKSLIALGAMNLLAPGAEVQGGKVRFEGEALADLDDRDWRLLVGMGIGVLFQDAIGAWDPIELVGEQAGEALAEHLDLTTDEIHRRVLDALGEVHLPRKRHFLAWPFEMSRGQAQRAMLASALVSAPRLLIADEPLSGLDVTVAQAILQLIEDMRSKRGMGMLLVTHDLGVVASVADRVAVVYGGMIVEQAAAVDLYRNPRHPYTSGLLGAVPGLGDKRLRPIPGETPDLFEVESGCPFAERCEHMVDRCRGERPAMRRLGDNDVACHRAEELSLTGVLG